MPLLLPEPRRPGVVGRAEVLAILLYHVLLAAQLQLFFWDSSFTIVYRYPYLIACDEVPPGLHYRGRLSLGASSTNHQSKLRLLSP